ncbi:MAG: alkaline phosphatase D family protein [Ilumatobacteraceae bacterium]
MAWLDDHLESTFTDVDERPQQLVLTGDQIYADDVGACLLPMLIDLGRDALGATERLTVADGGSGTVEATAANFPPLFRQRLVREQAGFTSTSAHNHLLSFGEFAAMYLAVWSPRVWRPLAVASDVVKSPGNVPAVVGDHLTKWDECAAERHTTLTALRTDAFDKERARVERFRSAVPKVARALANVATYLVFDDHEVTDDWNLNARWQQRVYTKPFGRQIVRNAVMAYAVFQAWGNDPKRYSKPDTAPDKPNHNRQLLEEIEKVFTGAGPYPAAAAQPGRLDELVGAASAPDRQPVFHVTVPGPRHLLVLLDTRTRRSFRGHGILPPNLLGSTLNEQVPPTLTDGRELLVVVSAAPVLGPHLIDSIGQPVAQNIQDMKVGLAETTAGLPQPGPCEASLDLGAEHYDAEGWSGDEEAQEALLNRLSPHGRVVILSGDVHYGCTLVLDHWRKGSANGGDPPPARIVQLTSSPACNSFDSQVEALLRNTAFLQRYELDPRPERLAWSGKASIAVPNGARIGPGRRARMNRSPALVPARSWPAGTTVPPDKPPDWRWRLSLQRDGRADDVLPTPLRQPRLGAELDPTDPLLGYRRIAARHAAAAFSNFDHLRQMVFTNNIGLVALFVGGDGALHVRHSMLSKDAPDSHLSSLNTVHDVSLAPTHEARPELVLRGS